MHTLKFSVVEVESQMVAVEVTKQRATQHIHARRTSINPLAEEAPSILSLPVSIALVRARYWQLTERFLFPLHA